MDPPCKYLSVILDCEVALTVVHSCGKHTPFTALPPKKNSFKILISFWGNLSCVGEVVASTVDTYFLLTGGLLDLLLVISCLWCSMWPIHIIHMLEGLRSTHYLCPCTNVAKSGNLHLTWKYAQNPEDHGCFAMFLHMALNS